MTHDPASANPTYHRQHTSLTSPKTVHDEPYGVVLMGGWWPTSSDKARNTTNNRVILKKQCVGWFAVGSHKEMHPTNNECKPLIDNYKSYISHDNQWINIKYHQKSTTMSSRCFIVLCVFHDCWLFRCSWQSNIVGNDKYSPKVHRWQPSRTITKIMMNHELLKLCLYIYIPSLTQMIVWWSIRDKQSWLINHCKPFLQWDHEWRISNHHRSTRVTQEPIVCFFFQPLIHKITITNH